MSTHKDFRFTVDVDRSAERTVFARSEEGLGLTIATPPEFRDGVPGLWSPEHLLVAATASCYALTLAAVAERREVPLVNASVTGAGHVTRRADGRFGFVVIELGVTLTTEEGFEDDMRRVARAAEAGCIVSQALEIPVEIELTILTAGPVFV
jgi:organic hydroperoxide reductase OsmC/OhrA